MSKREERERERERERDRDRDRDGVGKESFRGQSFYNLFFEECF